jgi:hypothetical protein
MIWTTPAIGSLSLKTGCSYLSAASIMSFQMWIGLSVVHS